MIDYRMVPVLERVANSLEKLVEIEERREARIFNTYNPPAEPTELTVERVRQLYEEEDM